MITRECECVTKWKKEIKRKFNAVSISVSPTYDTGSIEYRKIIVPKNVYKEEYNKPRISRYWFHAESKDFKFCPYCGKKLLEEENKPTCSSE